MIDSQTFERSANKHFDISNPPPRLYFGDLGYGSKWKGIFKIPLNYCENIMRNCVGQHGGNFALREKAYEFP